MKFQRIVIKCQPSWMHDGVVTRNIESELTKHHFNSNFWAKHVIVIFFLIICMIGLNWLKFCFIPAKFGLIWFSGFTAQF